MQIELRVTVEVERVKGKFAPKSDIEDFLIGELESVNPGTIDGIGADADSDYEVVEFEVEVI